MVLNSAFSVWVGKKLQKTLIGEHSCVLLSDAYSRTSLDLSKHIDVKYQVLVDSVTIQTVSLHYVLTKAMVTDIFTKILERSKSKTLIELINT